MFYGGTAFFIKELVVVAGASIYAFVFTYIMLMLTNLITPVKVSDEEEFIGLQYLCMANVPTIIFADKIP